MLFRRSVEFSVSACSRPVSRPAMLRTFAIPTRRGPASLLPVTAASTRSNAKSRGSVSRSLLTFTRCTMRLPMACTTSVIISRFPERTDSSSRVASSFASMSASCSTSTAERRALSQESRSATSTWGAMLNFKSISISRGPRLAPRSVTAAIQAAAAAAAALSMAVFPFSAARGSQQAKSLMRPSWCTWVARARAAASSSSIAASCPRARRLGKAALGDFTRTARLRTFTSALEISSTGPGEGAF
mmetsp:Transcript_11605/g.24506  ORF Transcript_11605/g.24506 Transcript_11605/m.24506 type:complete len:245 (-) Transcript_11605:2282-3016(-)